MINIQSSSQQTIQKLIDVVGKKNVMTGEKDTRLYRQGRRYGAGNVLAVVIPGTLVEQWKVLKIAVDDGCIVIMQAANTGLTGGSTPFGDDYDRPVLLMSTRRLSGIQVINEGKQVICLPGATLDRLEKELAVFNREPHSVIGSSCIGASVLGGVCNNSGGALVRRGPAYTELALYARVNDQGSLELVNHLGVNLGHSPEEILSNLEQRKYQITDIENESQCYASDHRYIKDVAKVDENTPARFNADPSRLFEASGSAGKVCVFAVRLDTFERTSSQVFYVGSNRQEDLTEIRRFLLKDLPRIPIAGEYIHRVAYDIGAEYGKDTFMFIEKFGTAKVPAAFAMKDKIDAYLEKLKMRGLSDKFLQLLTKFLPSHLPKRMNAFRNLYEHHLILRIEDQDVAAVEAFLERYFDHHKTGDYFLCDEDEGRKAFLHRFAVAGAAIRYRDTHRSEVEDIVALDIALRRNDREWVETLPKEMDEQILHKLYYGHFLCHVFHQDYIVKKNVDPLAMEHAMWRLLDNRGAEYPAEHNVGHLYVAKPALKNHYKKLDPTNTFNVGIGQTSKLKYWK
ncbi:D-lactate dehydrogenase [Acinetobacter bohemicus]|uniref:D-lactate dehydrogenase n=1 Tax=Acinetobacter sp. S4397-1 TaxID=2972915 RepID=UPI00209B7202|nr:D-lactate dehydrogenase [Acinetobacter sp. S4397-1]MCO8046452.1 D-lactate dehydrogenase [Acinetobacter sp. S4397-1]